MGLLTSVFNDRITITRAGEEREATVEIQSSRKIIARHGLDVRRGDAIRSEKFHEPHIVKKAEQHSELRHGEGYTSIDLVPESEWEDTRPAARTTITQNIGAAANVAGRDITGAINQTFSMAQMLSVLEEQIQKDPAIPPKDKPRIINKLKELMANSYVANIVSSMVWDVTKAAWTWGQSG